MKKIKTRYLQKLTDSVGQAIGDVMSRGKLKEAKGYNNMANLIRYNRETKGAMPYDSDYKDINFRTSVMARHAKSDFMSKDRAKKAKRFYQDDYAI